MCLELLRLSHAWKLASLDKFSKTKAVAGFKTKNVKEKGDPCKTIGT
jgi:hypothetical protein